VNVVPAVAGVGGNLPETMKRAYLSALGARRFVAELDPKQMLKAGIVVRESAEKILNAECGSHRYPSLTYNIAIASTYVKGIIASGH
jgi:hypothetical protein